MLRRRKASLARQVHSYMHAALCAVATVQVCRGAVWRVSVRCDVLVRCVPAGGLMARAPAGVLVLDAEARACHVGVRA